MLNNFIKNLSSRNGAAKLALVIVVILIIPKVLVAIITHSVSVYAQTADSFLDLFSIGVIVIALRMSADPADEKHPFGHGKMEGFAALIQALLVLSAGAVIIYSAVQRLIHRTVINPDTGIFVMAVSAITSFLLYRHLLRVAKTTGSTAIEASARMFLADGYSAAGVLLGLVAVLLTNWQILDPIIALLIAILVLREGYQIVPRAFRELTDYSLPKNEQNILNDCIRENFTQFVSFHNVRSRRAGSERFVDLHLVMPRHFSVEDAHKMCDHLEQDIKTKLPNTNVVIHVEPCSENDCVGCYIKVCDLQKMQNRTRWLK